MRTHMAEDKILVYMRITAVITKKDKVEYKACLDNKSIYPGEITLEDTDIDSNLTAELDEIANGE